METYKRTAMMVLAFGLFFMATGWLVPAMYATYAPSEQYVEEHRFEANDTTLDQQQHTVCFERTIHQDTTGSVFTELYLVDENGERMRIQSKSKKSLLAEGRATVSIDVTLPKDMPAGEYYYERAYRINLANGRVERTFTFTSNTFNITKEPTAASTVDC
jgi:hypothetical protein